MRLILSKPPRTRSEGLRRALNWLPLTKRKEMFRQLLVHRCMIKQAPEYLYQRFRSNVDLGCRMMRGHRKLHMDAVNTEYGRKSFSFQGVKHWNNLPAELRETSSRELFKKRLKLHYS